MNVNYLCRYEELREKTQSPPFCDDSAICDSIIKLQTFSHMDHKTVPYAKVSNLPN